MTGGRIVSKQQDAAWQRRRAADRREHKIQLLGSVGPAGPCKRIDPVSGEAVILHRVEVTGLTVASPVLDMPVFGIVPRNTVNQRRKRAREAAGRRRIVATPDFRALVEALIKSERLSERETRNRAKVAAAATEILNEWARRWVED